MFFGSRYSKNRWDSSSSIETNDFVFLGISLKDQPILVRKVLKSLWFVTTHTNQIRTYRLKTFGRSSIEHKFSKESGEEITVFDYFEDKWNIRLRHPQLPTVELFNPADRNHSHFLPMELVTIDEWQRSLKPLTTEQRAKVTRKTVVKPGERYGMIRRVADERRFDQDPFLQKFGLKIHSNEMLNLVKTNFFSQRIFMEFDLGMVTQCTRFDKLAANSEPREMDMYIQVGFLFQSPSIGEFFDHLKEFGAKL